MSNQGLRRKKPATTGSRQRSIQAARDEVKPKLDSFMANSLRDFRRAFTRAVEKVKDGLT